MPLWGGLLIFYGFICGILFPAILIVNTFDDPMPMLPWEIHNDSESSLNWFGATLISILLLIFFPTYYLFRILKVMCTAGKKKK